MQSEDKSSAYFVVGPCYIPGATFEGGQGGLARKLKGFQFVSASAADRESLKRLLRFSFSRLRMLTIQHLQIFALEVACCNMRSVTIVMAPATPPFPASIRVSASFIPIASLIDASSSLSACHSACNLNAIFKKPSPSP